MEANCLLALFYYIVGGITLPPLCLLAGLLYFVVCAPRVNEKHCGAGVGFSLAEDDGDISQEQKHAALDLAARNAKAQEQVEQAQRNGFSDFETSTKGIPGAAKRLGATQLPKVYRSGWLVMRRQFDSTTTQASVPSTGADTASAKTTSSHSVTPGTTTGQSKSSGYMSAMYRGILDYRTNRRQSTLAPPAENARATMPDSTTQPLPSTSSGRDHSSSPRVGSSSTAAVASSAAATLKDSYFCILKEPILYLYSSEDTSNPSTECLAAIDLRDKRVSIYVAGIGDVEGEPGDAITGRIGEDSTDSDIPDACIDANWNRAKLLAVKDGELFQKRNAIRILAPQTAASGHGRRPDWYVFLRSSTTMEDWYHALVHASLLPKESFQPARDPIGPVFDANDMQSLLSSLDSLPDPIPLRWLNAMFGRIFYSLYRTAWLEEYVTRKLTKKISRVRTPSFLSDIRVKEVHLGSTPPAFSRPMLKSLTGAGEASMEVGVHYTGALRLTISTVLTISLGSRFKPYTVPLVLAVVLTSLEGNLLLHVKPPPSNRLWFGFTHLPKIEVDIEPVVSERKVQWSMVKRIIESRIKELLIESIVVPNMDDVPFYDTRPNAKRGGIWAEAAIGSRRPATRATEYPIPINPTNELKQGTTRLTDGQSDHAVTTSKLEQDTSVLRRRQEGAGTKATISDSEEPLGETTTSLSASPAVAGLSALLARSAQGSAIRTPDAALARSQQRPAERKSWFAGSNRTGSAASASGVNSPNCHKGLQSSLAWGSASVIQCHQQPNPGPINNAQTDASVADHEEDKPSVSSAISDVTEANNITADTEVVQAVLERSLYLNGDDDDRDGAPDTATDKKTDLITPSAERHGDRHGADLATERPVLHERSPSGDDINDAHDETHVDREARTPSPLSPPGDPTLEPRRTASPASSSGFTERTSSLALVRSTHRFAPPPRRSVGPVAGSSPSARASGPTPHSSPIARTSLRDSHMTTRSLADGGVSVRSTGNGMASGLTTQAALMAGWSKAKASMADKDSRQAAARDAKEALKKGWASWNSRRGEAKSQASSGTNLPVACNVNENWARTFGQDRDDGTENRSEVVPSGSEGVVARDDHCDALWSPGSTHTDPVNLGAGFGFETSPHGSPEWQRESKASLHSGEGMPGPVILPASSGRARDYRLHRFEVSSCASSPAMSHQRQAAGKRRSDGDQVMHASMEVSSGPLEASANDGGGIQDKDGLAFLPPAAKPASAVVTSQDSPTSSAPTPQVPDTQPAKPQTVRVPSNGSTGSEGSTVRWASSGSVTSSAGRSPPRSVSTPTSMIRIRNQPGQMTMMAIPGIPAHRRRTSGGVPSSLSPSTEPAHLPSVELQTSAGRVSAPSTTPAADFPVASSEGTSAAFKEDGGDETADTILPHENVTRANSEAEDGFLAASAQA